MEIRKEIFLKKEKKRKFREINQNKKSIKSAI
jgi:hypothetical protein